MEQVVQKIVPLSHSLKHHSQQHYAKLVAVETPYLFTNAQSRQLISSSTILPQLENQVDPLDPHFIGYNVFLICCRNSWSLSLILSPLLTHHYLLLLLLNYRLSQKLKLLENCEFNQLTISLTLPLTCEPKLPLNKWRPNK